MGITRNLGYVTVLMAYVCGTTALASDECVIVSKLGDGDYTTIQAALDDPTRPFDDVVVMPGIYHENPLITNSVTLRAAEGPLMTVIDGITHVGGREDTITVDPDLANVQVIGFTITNGRFGLLVQTSSTGLISNCLVDNNTVDGIKVQWLQFTGVTLFEVRNNVIRQNGRFGVSMQQTRHPCCFETFPQVIQNNILIGNASFAIVKMSADGGTETGAFDVAGLPIIRFNNYFQNDPYGTSIGPGQTIPPGEGETFEDPLFLGDTTLLGFDVRLSRNPESPLIDRGTPGTSDRDPDGSRNDMGAFGGPGAASFFESVTDGPIVEMVVTTPPAVEQGETLTIDAIVKVR